MVCVWRIVYGIFCYQFVGGLAGDFLWRGFDNIGDFEGFVQSVSFCSFISASLCPAPFQPFDLFCPFLAVQSVEGLFFFGGPALF